MENASGAQEPDPDPRDRYVDFLRVAAIGFVVLGHWLVTSVQYAGGTFQAADVLREIRWAPWATWGFQVMPVFFLVGGFAAAVSWRHLGGDREHGGHTGYASRWLGRRVLRLLIPTTWYVAVALAAAAIAAGVGVSASDLSLAGWAVALHLWFLPVYLILTLLTPAMYAAHRRWGLAVPAVMAITATAIDILVVTVHVRGLGWLNYALVWGAAYQLGFAWQDGTLARVRRLPWSIAAVGAVTFAALEWSGLFPASLIGMTGERINNTSPPSVALLAYEAAQLGTLIAIGPRINAWLRRPRLWRVVEACNKEVMTVYLWHMFPLVAAGVLLYSSGVLPQPTPGSAEWWLLRPLWIAAIAAILVPLLLAALRLRRRQTRPAATPAPAPTLSSIPEAAGGNPLLLLGAITLTSIALARFAIAGFAPDGRLPVSAVALYSAGLLLIAANTLLLRRRPRPEPRLRAGTDRPRATAAPATPTPARPAVRPRPDP